MPGRPNRLAYLALASVSFFWGTTYLGIRISLEGLPPFYLIAIRYVISGGLLLVAAALGGMTIPRGRELWLTSVCGVLCIAFGNGCLAVSETMIPSGTAALFYTTTPFWMVGIDALLPSGKKPLRNTIYGLLLGLFGVMYLIYPDFIREGLGGKTLIGFLLLQLGALGWVFGALLQKRIPSEATPMISGAVQQLAAGLFMFAPALLFEKLPHTIAARPVYAVLYLVVFGSIVGYSSFIYSVAKLPVALMSIYTFVNPIVAVFLGWLFFREPFGTRGVIAMAIIFLGIAVVRWSESRGHKQSLPVLDTEAAGVS
jgi:drug/metabolite transporter (DMT)-like permease